MNSLRCFTTEYSEAQDRICLAGEDADGTIEIMWLTQRMLKRLVPHLCQWLEQRVGDTRMDVVRHEFAQQKARTEMTRRPHVRAESHSQDPRRWHGRHPRGRHDWRGGPGD
jgi:hypothetical protein